MKDDSPREDFLDRMVALCHLLGIEAPPDQAGDGVAYRLDLDDTTFTLSHSVVDRPESFLSECRLGPVPADDREASLAFLLQANMALGQRGLGALALDAAGNEAFCLSRIDLSLAHEAVLAQLLDVREVARAWGRRFWPSAAEQAALVRA